MITILDQTNFDYYYELYTLLKDKYEGANISWADIMEFRAKNTGTLEHVHTVSSGAKIFYEFFEKGLIPDPILKLEDDQINEETSALDIRLEKLKEERIKIQALKVELNRYDRQKYRFKLFYETLKDKMQELPLPNFEPIYTINNDNDEYLVLMSDIHYGAKFKSINNEYSSEICKQRLEKAAAHLIQLAKKEKIKKYNILNLGDTIQGILRLKDISLNEFAIPTAVVEVSRLIANFLKEISTVCEINYYHIQSANHTQIRPLNSQANELVAEDLEKIIVNYVHDLLLSNKRVTVKIDNEDEYLIFKIKDFNCIAMHGQQFRVGKKNASISDLSQLHRIFFDYAFFGHDHSPSNQTVAAGAENDCEVFIAGSVQGACPFADKIKKSSKASIVITKFTDNGITGTEKLILN